MIAQLVVGTLKVAAGDEAAYLLGALVLYQLQQRSRVQFWFWLSLKIQAFDAHSFAAFLRHRIVG